MMLIAVAEAAYIRPAPSPPLLIRDSSLWYEMASYWYLIALALGTRYGTKWYEITPCHQRATT